MSTIFWHITDSPYLTVGEDDVQVRQYGTTIGRVLFAQHDWRCVKLRAGIRRASLRGLRLTPGYNQTGVTVGRGVQECSFEDIVVSCMADRTIGMRVC